MEATLGYPCRITDNKTGYFGVQIVKPGEPKPYQVRLKRGGMYVYLGCFVTARRRRCAKEPLT